MIVVIAFGAKWCGLCAEERAVHERVAAKRPEITFHHVDVDADPAQAERFEIVNLPTLAILRDGILVFREEGQRSEAELERLLSKIAALDMDAVRAELQSEAQRKNDPIAR